MAGPFCNPSNYSVPGQSLAGAALCISRTRHAYKAMNVRAATAEGGEMAAADVFGTEC
jgi:hypothetical protein